MDVSFTYGDYIRGGANVKFVLQCFPKIVSNFKKSLICLGLSVLGDGANPILPQTFLPAGTSQHNPADVNSSPLAPFGGYHSALALQEQVRQAMIGAGDKRASNPSITAAGPSPLAYQMIGPAGLAIHQMVGRQNGRWPRSQSQVDQRRNDTAVRGKSRGRGSSRNDTCQYCGKVSIYYNKN